VLRRQPELASSHPYTQVDIESLACCTSGAKTILLVDDDEVTRHVLGGELAKLGYRPLGAATWAAAKSTVVAFASVNMGSVGSNPSGLLWARIASRLA
jgi:hypothetical protein